MFLPPGLVRYADLADLANDQEVALLRSTFPAETLLVTGGFGVYLDGQFAGSAITPDRDRWRGVAIAPVLVEVDLASASRERAGIGSLVRSGDSLSIDTSIGEGGWARRHLVRVASNLPGTPDGPAAHFTRWRAVVMVRDEPVTVFSFEPKAD